ncbi:MAG: hypothetical protein HY228_00975 [Candidatus Yonathbacteria bacterium]|nr:hypothetical protein [Candidatus Yonathbacteria bacterium]
MKNFLRISLIVSTLFMGTMGVIDAAETVKLDNPLKAEYGTFSQLVEGVTKAAVSVLMPFVVIAFIYAGFLFVKAQGKPEEIKKVKEIFFYSVIGAFILFGAWSFAQIIGKTVTSITGV